MGARIRFYRVQAKPGMFSLILGVCVDSRISPERAIFIIMM